MICDYGCGQEAKYQFKNGKYCCSKSYNSCPQISRIKSEKLKGKYTGEKSSAYGRIPWNKGKTYTIETRIKMSNCHKGVKLNRDAWNKGKKNVYSKKTILKMKKAQIGRKHSQDSKDKISRQKSFTSKDYKTRYPMIFSKIEKIRDNKNGNIEVKCKHCFKWFIPTKTQIYERIRQINHGNGGCNFYCSDECKTACSIFNQKLYRKNHLKNNNFEYTSYEYQVFRKFVLERDNYICQFCGKKATYVHHERPQKLEPFFALDPDFAWSCCEKCHYEKGHPSQSNCSTANIANRVCL